jgi:hypothetical protein
MAESLRKVPAENWLQDYVSSLRVPRRPKFRMVRFAFTPVPVFVAGNRQTAAKLRRQGYSPVWTEETAAKWIEGYKPTRAWGGRAVDHYETHQLSA